MIEGLKPYPAYREPGVPWHKWLLQRMERPARAPNTARLEHDKALERVVVSLLKDDTELFEAAPTALVPI
jgi:hypothetical protein